MTSVVRPLTLEQDLKTLETSEYHVRKYRTRGDARAEQGNDRSSTEYHQMASKERAKAEEVRARLTEQLGPDGGPGLPLAGVLALARRQAPVQPEANEIESFEAACFFHRHPRWANLVEGYVSAAARWQDTPELEAVRPEFHPIWDSWTD